MNDPKTLNTLSPDEKSLLLSAPAIVSVLASGHESELDAAQKADAIKLSHYRTFTADAALLPYYNAVEKVFEEQLTTLIEQHVPLNSSSREALEKQLQAVNKLLGKMEEKFANALRKSLNSYAKHVHSANKNAVELFVMPFHLPGLDN